VTRAVSRACLILVLFAGAAAAQTVDDLFDDSAVHELRILINERDLAELRERYQENVFFPVDMQWRGVRVRNVGLRSRGLSSRSATKPGLKLDFNYYVSGQRFLGLKSLVLDNLVTDASMVRERVAMRFIERMGEAAPRESFARVYINDRYEGVYAVVEPVDGDFLQRTGGERAGYLFERRHLDAYRADDLGDDPALYRQVFEPRTHEHEGDTILFSPVRDLFQQANAPIEGAWREALERYIDLRQFVTYVAIEMFLAETDGVLGTAGMANFYLYRPEASERHRFITWDKDRTFSDVQASIFARAEENILFTRALGFVDLRRLYYDVLERCALTAAHEHWLEREVDRLAALVGEAARDDANKPYAQADHEAALEFVRQFAQLRPTFVIQELSRWKEGM
jgi:spore coat protein CotH